jgi:nucleoside-diphosphate-sugar epimerase
MDMVHVENAVDAHLAAETALAQCHLLGDTRIGADFAGSPTMGESTAGGRAYFITNDEPVVLWDWINGLLGALGEQPVTRCVSLQTAAAVGALCEAAWRVLPLRSEPPMTRFIAAELAKDHWFSIAAARRDLGYAPRISMAAGTAELVAALRAARGQA